MGVLNVKKLTSQHSLWYKKLQKREPFLCNPYSPTTVHENCMQTILSLSRLSSSVIFSEDDVIFSENSARVETEYNPMASLKNT